MFIPSFMGFDKAGFGDPDALAFFARVTAAGGSLTATEKSAVNTLVVQMKADGTWTPMKAIYPMVGASAAACAQNLKSASFTGAFTATGWTFASTGATPNGTSAYMETFFNINTEQTASNDYTQGFYSGTIGGANANRCSLGAVSGGSQSDLLIKFSDGNAYLLINEATYNNAFINADTHGFYVANRPGTNTTQSWKDGVKIVDVINVPVTKTTQPLYLSARNDNGNPATYDNKRCQFAFMGNGLTDVKQGDLYTAVQAFQTTLGR